MGICGRGFSWVLSIAVGDGGFDWEVVMAEVLFVAEAGVTEDMSMLAK